MNRALNNCGPKNILQELAKRMDQKQVEALEIEKAHLATEVAAMTQELAQKNEEIRKHHAEQGCSPKSGPGISGPSGRSRQQGAPL